MVWSYFTSLEDGTAVQCNICTVKVSQGARKASQRKHQHFVGAHHKETYGEAHEERVMQQSTKMTTSSQPTLKQVFNRQAKLSAAETHSKTFDRLILEMIATDIQPFEMVSNVGFQRLMSAAELRYFNK